MGVWWSILMLGLLAAGVVLLAVALWGSPSRGRRRCPHCWYDMAATATTAEGFKCPECGRVAAGDQALLRRRVYWRWAVAGLGLVAAAGVLHEVRAFRKDGWQSVPRPLMCIAAGWVDLNAGTAGVKSMNGALVRRTDQRLTQVEQWLLRRSLARKMRSSDPEQRTFGAIFASRAWRGGNEIDALVPRLRELLGDVEGNIAYACADALGNLYMGDPSWGPVWERLMLTHPEDGASAQGAALLGWILETGDHSSIPALMRAAREGSGMTRNQAMRALARVQSEEVARFFIDILDSPNDVDRWSAVECLSRMSQQAEIVAPAVIPLLEDRSWRMYRGVVSAVGRLGKSAHSAVPALLRELETSTDQDIRKRAAASLGQIGVASPEVIEALCRDVQLLNSSEQGDRVEALFRLGWAPDAEYRSILQHIAETAPPQSSVWIRLLLARADGALEEQIPELIALIDSDDVWESIAAIEALATFGPKAAAALPHLKPLTERPIGRKPLDSDRGIKVLPAKEAIRAIEGY